MTDAEIIAALMQDFYLCERANAPSRVLYGEQTIAGLDEPLGRELAQRIRLRDGLAAVVKAERNLAEAQERLKSAKHEMDVACAAE